MTYILVYWFFLLLGWVCCWCSFLLSSLIVFFSCKISICLFWWFLFLCWTSHFVYAFLNFSCPCILIVHWNSLRGLFWIPCQAVHRSPAAWGTWWVSWQHLWAVGFAVRVSSWVKSLPMLWGQGAASGWALWLLMVDDISGCASWPDGAHGWILCLCRAIGRALRLDGTSGCALW